MAGQAPITQIVVTQFGQRGVNVDLNPLELHESDLVRAQNAIADVAAGRSSIRKRPGLIAVATNDTAGTVLGGVDLPLADVFSGTHTIYVGRTTL